MENPGLEFSFVQPKATFIGKVRQAALKGKELPSLPVLNLVPDQKEKVEELSEMNSSKLQAQTTSESFCKAKVTSKFNLLFVLFGVGHRRSKKQ